MAVLDFLDDELVELVRRDRLRVPRVVTGAQGTRIVLDGREVVSFSSNDYLGLAGHAALRAAAVAEIERAGIGSGASRLIVGNQEAHVALEASLAELCRTASATLFASGFAANTGLLPVLASERDVIFSDQLNHASIIDGCRLSRARVEVFRHGDLEDLERRLGQVDARRTIIVTESVFSMDGDLCDLARLVPLARQRGAVLVVDEAHAMGVFGPRGGGLLEALNLHADVVVGTLGKAFGASGAWVAGSASLAKVLWNRARPMVFSTGAPSMVAAAARAAVGLVRGSEGESRRSRLSRNVGLLAQRLGVPATGPIVPFLVGQDDAAMQWTQFLLDRGIFVQGIRPPTVPEGTARLRIALSADHDEADVERLVEGIRTGITAGLVSRETVAS